MMEPKQLKSHVDSVYAATCNRCFEPKTKKKSLRIYGFVVWRIMIIIDHVL